MVPVSNDTLLRVVRRRVCLRTDPLKVVGIDWAYRRNHRYGTIVCDLERRRIVTLLPHREDATVEAWLADHPEIETVSRDRGGGYGEATAKALPKSSKSCGGRLPIGWFWHRKATADMRFSSSEVLDCPIGDLHSPGENGSKARQCPPFTAICALSKVRSFRGRVIT